MHQNEKSRKCTCVLAGNPVRCITPGLSRSSLSSLYNSFHFRLLPEILPTIVTCANHTVLHGFYDHFSVFSSSSAFFFNLFSAKFLWRNKYDDDDVVVTFFSFWLVANNADDPSVFEHTYLTLLWNRHVLSLDLEDLTLTC